MTDFQNLQRQFAAYIRDPLNSPLPPGCDVTRMQHYHHLFFNNFDGVLELAYPRLSAALEPTDWSSLTRRFFQTQPQHSPYLSDVPAQFAAFLDAQTLHPLNEGHRELAAFELACFELKAAADAPQSLDAPGFPAPQGDTLPPTWVINPDTILFESLYPVHDPDWNPDPGFELDSELDSCGAAQTPSFLVLVRDPAGRVQTHVLSAASARLLQLMHVNPSQPIAWVVAALAQELNQPAAQLSPLVQQQIHQWVEQHVLRVVGGRR